MFLTTVREMYVNRMQNHGRYNDFDGSYKLSIGAQVTNNESKTSWERFIYNFGFVYYVPSFFLGPYKLLCYVYREMLKLQLQLEIYIMKENLNKSIESESDRNHYTAFLNDLNQFESYLYGAEGFQENELENLDAAGNRTNETHDNEDFKKVNEVLKDIYDRITNLVDRPIPLPVYKYL